MSKCVCDECGEPMVRFDGAKDAESDGNPDDFWFNGWICEPCGVRKPLASYMNGRAKLKAQFEEPVSIETTDSETTSGIDNPQIIHDMCVKLGSINRDIGDDGVAETPSKDAESVEDAINSLMFQFATEWNPFGQSRFGSEYHLDAVGLDPEDAHPVLHHGVIAGVLLKEDHVYYLASPPPPMPPEGGEGDESDGEGEGEADAPPMDDEGEGEGEGESEDSEGEDGSESGADSDSEGGDESDGEGGEGGESSDGDGSEGESGEGGEGEGDSSEGEGQEGEGGESDADPSGEGGEGKGEGGQGGSSQGGTGDMMDEASSKSFKEWLAEQSEAIKDSFGEGESGATNADFNAFGGDGMHNTGGVGTHSLDAQGEADGDGSDGHDEYHRRKGSASDFMRKAMRGKKFKDTFGDYEGEME